MPNTDIKNAVPTDFSLKSDGSIHISHRGNEYPIATLAKGDNITTPSINISHTTNYTAEELRQRQQTVEKWITNHIKTVLDPLLSLQDIALSGTGRGIAFQLYESFGFLYRNDVLDLIKDISKEDRQFLGKRGVRLGAYYVYQRDMLKPAAVELRAALWRAFHDVSVEKTPTPPAGNVSMAVAANTPKAFYRTIGFPIFGHTAVRMDMVERVNSAVYDGAKDGKYTFDPALASTIGVGVEDLYAILADLGFRYEDIEAPKLTPDTDKTTETSVDKSPPTPSPLADKDDNLAHIDALDKNDEEDNKAPKTIRVYHLKKAPIKPLRSKRPPHQKGKKHHDNKAKTPHKKQITRAEKQPDPDSPFAALQSLIKK